MRRLALLTSLLAAMPASASSVGLAPDDPVAVMLKDEYDSISEQAEYWRTRDEVIFEAMASSAAARSPHAREALWTALRSGQTLAAGVLWRLDRDQKVVGFLLDALKRDDFKPPFGRDEIPFVLAYTRDRRALPALWAEIDRAPTDPYRRCLYAKAVYRISRDPKVPVLLRRIRDTEQPPLPDHESKPQDMAHNALIDLGLEPAPKRGQEGR